MLDYFKWVAAQKYVLGLVVSENVQPRNGQLLGNPSTTVYTQPPSLKGSTTIYLTCKLEIE